MQDENPKTSKTYSEEQIKKMLRDLSFLKKVILQVCLVRNLLIVRNKLPKRR
jgi:hypothetical protein